MSWLDEVKPGDRVLRLLTPARIPMELTVTKVHEGLVHCGPWTFDQQTGVEEDAELEWGKGFGRTGSWLARKL